MVAVGQVRPVEGGVVSGSDLLRDAEVVEEVVFVEGEKAVPAVAALLKDENPYIAARAMAASLQDFIEIITGWMRGQYDFDPAKADEKRECGLHATKTADTVAA